MTKNIIMGTQKLGPQWTMESPFIFCAHHQDRYPKANANMGPDVPLTGRNIGSDFSGKDGFSMYHGEKVPGFPAHPHRGFETVTVVLDGFVDHFDSSGSTGRYGNGDVQWLTTGSGCQHSEMFPLLREDAPNPIELFQIWLNLPAKDKSAAPYYKMFWAEDVPEIDVPDANGKNVHVRLIAGSFNGHASLEPAPASWAHDPANHVGIFIISMEPGAKLVIPAGSETLLCNLYFYRGDARIKIADTELASGLRIKLAGNSDIEIENGSAPAFMALMEGEPINESVVQYGPFVMNTEAGIREAIREYQQTEYGGWPWDSYDQVHPRSEGRFAKYADGTIERK